MLRQRRTSRFVVPCLVGLVAIGAGCGGDDGGGGATGGVEYFPHNDGYLWIYHEEGDDPGTGEMTFSGTSTVDGQTIQLLHLYDQETPSDVMVLGMRIDGDGAWVHEVRLEGLAYRLSTPLPFLDFPLEEGKSWSGETTVFVGLLEVTVTIDTRVTDFGAVDAGGIHYEDCFHLESDITASSPPFFTIEAEAILWMAPAVGVVSGESTVPPSIITGPVEGHSSFYLLDKNF